VADSILAAALLLLNSVAGDAAMKTHKNKTRQMTILCPSVQCETQETRTGAIYFLVYEGLEQLEQQLGLLGTKKHKEPGERGLGETNRPTNAREESQGKKKQTYVGALCVEIVHGGVDQNRRLAAGVHRLVEGVQHRKVAPHQHLCPTHKFLASKMQKLKLKLFILTNKMIWLSYCAWQGKEEAA
jgi:hypothetical protein